MTDPGPIGVFDSGVGGLAVAAAIRRLLPRESIVYFADSAHFPYGPRTAGDLRRLTEAATRLLLDRGVKLIVVACNTGSSASLASLRATFPDVPFVGMVPALKPASAYTRTRKVGVLATEGTLQGKVLRDLVAQFAQGVEVERVAAPELAGLIESGESSGEEAAALVHRFVEPLLARRVDVIVLGCSHFAFLLPQVQRLAGPDVLVLEPGDAIARQVGRLLSERGLEAGDGAATFRCLTSGEPDRLGATIERLRALTPDMVPEVDAIEAVMPAATTR